ncbi:MULTISPECIES: universal stress protein [Calditerrivibrio]|jgi:nucleotide-binding universal stress UspA family protein|uniref:Universal stress protein n=1 Tax=Calditerrivibrio nitroreducens TaxID=477976 RepID=A0A2J6WM39_9BACT|nr:MAG: universal stress protein [Calditerrivibrio nitroreducens]
MIEIKKILVPTDFSETSRYAMQYAINFAKSFGAELEIVHVIFDESQIVAFYLPQVTFQNLDQELEESAKKQMEEFIASFPELNEIRYSTKMLKGTAFVEIISEAKTYGADIIIIGTHGRTGIEHVLFGSTAEKVVRKAPCPVFTVKPKNFNFRLP